MVATFKGQPSTIGMNHPLLCTEMDAESEMVVESDNRRGVHFPCICSTLLFDQETVSDL